MAGRDRIHASLVPGMALGQPADSEIASFYYSVFGDCLLGISRAGGVEAAVVTQERAYQQFVAGNQVDKEATH